MDGDLAHFTDEKTGSKWGSNLSEVTEQDGGRARASPLGRASPSYRDGSLCTGEGAMTKDRPHEVNALGISGFLC